MATTSYENAAANREKDIPNTSTRSDNIYSSPTNGAFSEPAQLNTVNNNRGDQGHNPLKQAHTNNGDAWLPAFGGEFQPGLYRAVEPRKLANPAPLGLSGFAMTTFVLSLVNLRAREVSVPDVVVGLAYAYGGVAQLLAGMWEMAVGNTFGATAFSSYGGFWIAYAILLTPTWNILGADGPYHTEGATAVDPKMASSAVGFFLIAWFVWTTILMLLTLRSTVIFFLLFFTLDLGFLMLACSEFAANEGKAGLALTLTKAGGGFTMVTAFLAWYNAFAGMADSSNSFYLIPVFHFPWSEKGRQAASQKSERATV